MGVERGRTGELVFLRREFLLQPLALPGPLAVVVVEDLGHPTPTDVFDQRRLFLLGRRTFISVQQPKRLDGSEILLKLLLWPTVAQPIGLGDAVTVEISGRLFLVAMMVAVRVV